MTRTLAFVFAAISLTTNANSQKSWWDVEYGIGLVSFQDRENAKAVVFTQPSQLSDTLVVLDGWELRFVKEEMTYPSKGLMVEFDYDRNGFPILDFSADSNWVKITVDCTDTSISRIGWISLKQEHLLILRWPDILPKHAVFFFKDEYIQFYSYPDPDSVISVPLVQVKNPEEFKYSYSIHPLQVKGRWLEVEVTTPYSPCLFTADELRLEFGETPRTVRAWIQYLDQRMHPRVFFFTRGC